MGGFVIVETSGGKVRVSAECGIHSFKGIYYGADTGGPHRFQPPRPIAWASVRDALRCGPRSPQNEAHTDLPHLTWLRDRTPEAEDCLALNVFTRSIEEGPRRPVMVYLHGGGFAIGSAGAPGIDGSNLARRDVVVVSVNHRLNLFGHLYLGDADDGRYAGSGNAGLLDLIAALHWVQQNIARFGGDAANVTLFGQSGGGSKVAVLMAMPLARGLFHKAIVQSESSLLTVATREDAERNTHHFLAALGLDRSKLHQLHQLPAQTLLAAMLAAVRLAVQVDNYRPVVDGRTLPCQPFDVPALQLSADIPFMTGWCQNEQRLTFASRPEVYRQSAQEAVASIALALGTEPDAAAALMYVYRAGRPHDTPGDLYAQIFGDHRYRRSVTRAADLRAEHGRAPAYLYLLAWTTPVLDGLLRTPHTLCIPFALANVDLATGITGTGDDRHRLQAQMAAAWVAFARSGDPNHAELPAWLMHSAATRSTMVFDRHSRRVDDPNRDERIALERCPRYDAAISEGRLRSQ